MMPARSDGAAARTKDPLTADAYIRVSRVAGREGESFISPETQRKKIEGWAELHDTEIVQWWEELDASGARRDRPMFQSALERCERGDTGGIVVARLDRFARSAVDALESIKRLNEAGARLVSVEDNFDGSTPMGRFAIGILTLIAELELERIKESWSTAVRSAIDRGVHISATPPAGYTRELIGEGKKGRLIRVEPDATFIAEAFRRRALGESWTKIAEFLTDNGVRSSKGSPAWSVNGVASLLRNRAYLGEARSGSAVNPNAHEPIVTAAEFDAVQSTSTLYKQHDGSVASKALLGGLVHCAGCGFKLQIAGNKDRSGETFPSYYCKGRSSRGKCAERATIRASYLDSYVEAQVLAALGDESGLLAQAVLAAEQIDEAQREADAAEHELMLYLETDLISTIGQAAFRQGVSARQVRLDEAREKVAALRAQAVVAEDVLSGDLLEAWPDLTIPERRQLMHGLLEKVVLVRSDGRNKATLKPIEERTTIMLRGGQVLPHSLV
jgi:DNA invertase Pin-like site-specific DNA recombinase